MNQKVNAKPADVTDVTPLTPDQIADKILNRLIAGEEVSDADRELVKNYRASQAASSPAASAAEPPSWSERHPTLAMTAKIVAGLGAAGAAVFGGYKAGQYRARQALAPNQSGIPVVTMTEAGTDSMPSQNVTSMPARKAA